MYTVLEGDIEYLEDNMLSDNDRQSLRNMYFYRGNSIGIFCMFY